MHDPCGLEAKEFRTRRPVSRWVRTALLLASLGGEAIAQTRPTEIHDRIGQADIATRQVALTLDACSGAFDEDLILFLIRNRIPATLFVTKKWLDKNPRGLAILKKNLDLFEIEDHGENHIPAVIGAGRKVYGITGEPDVIHLRREVLEGARAIERATGVAPHWYRGATAQYDRKAADEIRRLGFGIAGFSVNADAGASLKRAQVLDRLRHVRGGDVIIAHMNKPVGDTAEAMSDGLIELRRRGLVFVRLDQVDLVEITGSKPSR
jgi:peptidoglycan/xylan/chitin deacetylase (PgdA/CDA1 family)